MVFMIFGIDPKMSKSLEQNKKMKRKRCQGGRARTAGALRVTPGKVYQALRGGPLLHPSSPNFLGAGPPRKLLFSMPIFASIFDDILATF
jgi:hypothetical protein